MIEVDKAVIEYAERKYEKLYAEQKHWTRKYTVEHMRYVKWLDKTEPIRAELNELASLLWTASIGVIHSPNVAETYNRLKAEYEEQK